MAPEPVYDSVAIPGAGADVDATHATGTDTARCTNIVSGVDPAVPGSDQTAMTLVDLPQRLYGPSPLLALQTKWSPDGHAVRDVVRTLYQAVGFGSLPLELLLLPEEQAYAQSMLPAVRAHADRVLEHTHETYQREAEASPPRQPVSTRPRWHLPELWPSTQELDQAVRDLQDHWLAPEWEAQPVSLTQSQQEFAQGLLVSTSETRTERRYPVEVVREAQKKRDKVRQRATALLVSLLTPTQRKAWEAGRNFCERSLSGRCYSIGEDGLMILDKQGRAVESLCVLAKTGVLPPEDLYAAQLLYIRHDEATLLRTANHFGLRLDYSV